MNLNLKQQTILLTVAGSRAYGLHTESSDVDIKGVLTLPSEYIMGFLQGFEQVDDQKDMEMWIPYLTEEQKDAASREKIEGTIYELRKFMKLATDCNPNILDSLFCREEEVLYSTETGKLLRDNRDLFLSAKAKHTFSGYAFAQLKRIENHRAWLLSPPTHKPTRIEFGLAEGNTKERNDYNKVAAAIQKKVDSWSWDFGLLPKSEIQRIETDISQHLTEIGVVDGDLWNHAAASVSIPGDVIAHIAQEKKYMDASRNWKQYNSWKRNRNPERAKMEAEFGFDLKHGAHLVRLLRMGKEILTTGKVNVWRGDIDREELLGIRSGAWTYEKLLEYAEAEDKALTVIYKSKDYVLEHAPDRKKLNELCVKIYESRLK